VKPDRTELAACMAEIEKHVKRIEHLRATDAELLVYVDMVCRLTCVENAPLSADGKDAVKLAIARRCLEDLDTICSTASPSVVSPANQVLREIATGVVLFWDDCRFKGFAVENKESLTALMAHVEMMRVELGLQKPEKQTPPNPPAD